jgi:hypothetical protein
MRPNAKLIAEAIETADTDTIALVEELMRADRTGLDSLSPAEFRTAAREASLEALLMHNEGILAAWCDALALAMPAWTKATA